MKIKNLLTFGLLLSGMCFFNACKDKNGDGDNAEDLKWSENTVQQNKEAIEVDGMKMLDEMKAMENEPAVETNVAFVKFLAATDPFENNMAVDQVNMHHDVILNMNYALSQYDGTNLNGMYKAMSVTSFEDPETLLAMYNELVGVYSWNAEYEYWEYNQTGDVIVFEFPSTENGLVNDASYTITFVPYGGPFVDPELEDNLPTSASAVLAVGDQTYMGCYLNVDYDAEGYPNNIETSVVVGDYTMSASASNMNNSAFNANYSFTHGSDVLIDLTVGANGNWTQDNIENNIVTTYYVEYYNEETGNYEWKEIDGPDDPLWNSADNSWTEEEFQVWKVVTGGNASFQAMNMLIEGQVDMETLGNTLDNIDYTGDYSLEEAQAEADAVNDNVTLALKYADTGAIIAMGEAFVDEYEYSDYYGYYDDNGNWVEESSTKTGYELNIRFVFADGSKIDAETYFDTGFEDLINDLEDFADELGSTYGGE